MAAKTGLYARVPKDLFEVQTKLIFGLTKRQIICFSIGGAIAVPVFFLTRGLVGNTIAIFLMMFAMFPMVLIAIYKKNGQPFEKYLKHRYRWRFVKPQTRPYKTENVYDFIADTIHEREVLGLESKKGKKRAGR